MSDRLEKLRAKKVELERAIRQERSKEKAQKRKEDTRRKVLVGAELMHMAQSDDRAAVLLDEAIRRIRAKGERDGATKAEVSASALFEAD